MPEKAPLLPRLDPTTRKPLKSPPMRRCTVDLVGRKPMEIQAASVLIHRGEFRAMDADGNMLAAVAAGSWLAWHFQPVEVELPPRHRLDPREIT